MWLQGLHYLSNILNILETKDSPKGPFTSKSLRFVFLPFGIFLWEGTQEAEEGGLLNR